MMDKHYCESDLLNYLRESLDEHYKSKIKNHLKVCPDCFENYVLLKEANYFLKTGPKIDTLAQKKILSALDSKTTIYHYIIRLFQDGYSITEGNQFNLKVRNFRLKMAYR